VCFSGKTGYIHPRVRRSAGSSEASEDPPQAALALGVHKAGMICRPLIRKKSCPFQGKVCIDPSYLTTRKKRGNHMKYLREVRLPCWFVLAWLVVLGLLLPTLVRSTARPIVKAILLFAWGGIYLYGFSVRKPRYFLVSLLVIQTLLLLFLALITQSVLLTLGLSLALFVAMIDWLRKIRLNLPVIEVYLALFWFFLVF
jgi:hypothetical protein